MATEVRSGANTLTDASQAIKVAQQDLQDMTVKINRKIDETQGSFEGAAAQAFRQVGTEWARRQTAINQILEEFQRGLTGADASNKDSDSSAASALTAAGEGGNRYAGNANL